MDRLLAAAQIHRPNLMKLVLALSALGHLIFLSTMDANSAAQTAPIVKAMFHFMHQSLWTVIFAFYILSIYYATIRPSATLLMTSSSLGIFLWGFMTYFMAKYVGMGPLLIVYFAFFVASIWATLAFYEDRRMFQRTGIDYADMLQAFRNEQLRNVRKQTYDRHR